MPVKCSPLWSPCLPKIYRGGPVFYMHYAVSIPFIILLGSNMKNIIKTFLSIFICTRKLILTCTVQSIISLCFKIIDMFLLFCQEYRNLSGGKSTSCRFFRTVGF